MTKRRVAFYGDVVQWQNDGTGNNLDEVQAIGPTPYNGTTVQGPENGYALSMYNTSVIYWFCTVYPGDYLMYAFGRWWPIPAADASSAFLDN